MDLPLTALHSKGLNVLTHSEPTLVAIEAVPLGSRIRASNPLGEYDFSLSEPDQTTWVKIALITRKLDGSLVDAEVLRPRDLVIRHHLTVGAVVRFDSEELELEGLAEIVAIDDCPSLASGDGEVVTGRFVTRQVGTTIKTTFSTGTILEGTPVHLIWSPDREQFLPFGDFQPGDTVLGKDGLLTVESIEYRSQPVPVYNLEVHGEHVYEVTADGILVHNTSSVGNSLSNAANSTAGPTGNIYSVAFEAQLSSTSYRGVSRAGHFQQANQSLLEMIEADSQFAQTMQNAGVNLQRTPMGLAPRRPPAGWTWHHAQQPGLMQLVPRLQHTPGSIFWNALHPFGQGGFSIWGT